MSRWDALTRYIEDGRLSIDNNLSERLLRGIAVTRKNFLCLGSDRGGVRAATIYTIVDSAKLIGLDPGAYFAAILNRLAHGHPMNRIDELLPWNFKSAPAAASWQFDQRQPCKSHDAYTASERAALFMRVVWPLTML